MTKIYLFRADVAAYCDDAQDLLGEIRENLGIRILFAIGGMRRF